MVFGFSGGSGMDHDKKLQEERTQQEEKIAAELKGLDMDQKLQDATMTQKGLIARQQQQEEKKEEIAAAAAAASTTKEAVASSSSSSSNSSVKKSKSSQKKNEGKQPEDNKRDGEPLGPFAKLQQHVQMAQKGYEQLVHAIVRPPRANNYKPNDRHLGDTEFTFLGQRFERHDVTLLTERGLNIVGSHWRPKEQEQQQQQQQQQASDNNNNDNGATTVLIYMHGNASARVEVFQQLSFLLSLGTSVFAFDFAGSGLSDGDYVSLGYYEREDLATVIAHLRSTMGSNVRIGLWGRSMGAATALMYASREITLPHQNVTCMILDSSFCDLVKLAEEMVEKAREQGVVVPGVVVSVALTAIRWSVQKKAQFDIRDISPYSHSPDIKIPALFVCGQQDDFIQPHHSEIICEPYGGPKNLLMVKGDHNDLRPPLVFESAHLFLSRHLLQNAAPNCHLDVPKGLNLQNAPWQHRRNTRVYQRHDPTPAPMMMATPTSPTSLAATAAAHTAVAGASHGSSLAGTTSSTVSDVDMTQIGMTKERQDDIQGSVLTMLGGEDEGRAK